MKHRYYHERSNEFFELGPIDLEFRPGEVTFIVGGNGCGKTTLAKLLVGLYPPEAGSIWLNDERMSNTRILRTRLPATTHTVVEAIARQQQRTESAWLRRPLETTLQSSGVVLAAESKDEPQRQARLTIRLLADDQVLLHARAKARAMPAATYASMVIRSHLRGVVPLPKEERFLLNQ